MVSISQADKFAMAEVVELSVNQNVTAMAEAANN